ncbi:hypothetical protein DOO74_07165 [Rhodobacteraceae bacterium AsT-22]|nr:hypothetical protein DOO74_07165 [Rhodobacteraceae bacterium AsT-22]
MFPKRATRQQIFQFQNRNRLQLLILLQSRFATDKAESRPISPSTPVVQTVSLPATDTPKASASQSQADLRLGPRLVKIPKSAQLDSHFRQI